jgi:hypothetical protein
MNVITVYNTSNLLQQVVCSWLCRGSVNWMWSLIWRTRSKGKNRSATRIWSNRISAVWAPPPTLIDTWMNLWRRGKRSTRTPSFVRNWKVVIN